MFRKLFSRDKPSAPVEPEIVEEAVPAAAVLPDVRFMAVKTFKDEGSEYVDGMTYVCRGGNVALRERLDNWIENRRAVIVDARGAEIRGG